MRDLRFFSPRGPLQPGQDGRIWAYYNVLEAGAVGILYTAGYLAPTMSVDGALVQTATTYTFDEPGEHLIKFSAVNHTLAANAFRSVSCLKRIYIPEGPTVLPTNYILQANAVELVVLPASIVTLNSGSLQIRTKGIATLVFRGNVPPSGSITDTTTKWSKVYVPYSSDHSILAAYQNAFSDSSNVMFELNPNGTVPDNS